MESGGAMLMVLKNVTPVLGVEVADGASTDL
jgi:hypothetical protein